MTNETQNTMVASDKEDKRPDYVVKQYRYVRLEDGFKLRKETIGVAWNNEKKGCISIRPNGVQVIENDIYLFLTESKEAQ